MRSLSASAKYKQCARQTEEEEQSAMEEEGKGGRTIAMRYNKSVKKLLIVVLSQCGQIDW